MKKYITTPMRSIFVLLISFQFFSLLGKCEGQTRVYFADGDSLDGKLIYEADAFLEINPEGDETYRKIYKYELTKIKYLERDSVQIIEATDTTCMVPLDLTKPKIYYFLEDTYNNQVKLSVLFRSPQEVEKAWIPARDKQTLLNSFKSDLSTNIYFRRFPVGSYMGEIDYPFQKPIKVGLKYDSGEEEVYEATRLPIKDLKFRGNGGMGNSLFKFAHKRPIFYAGKSYEISQLNFLSAFLSGNISLYWLRLTLSGKWDSMAGKCYYTNSKNVFIYRNDSYGQIIGGLGIPFFIHDYEFEPVILGGWIGGNFEWIEKKYVSSTSTSSSKILLKEDIDDLGIGYGLNLRIEDILFLKYEYLTTYEGTHNAQISPIFPVLTFPDMSYLTLSMKITYSKDGMGIGLYTGGFFPSLPASKKYLNAVDRGVLVLAGGTLLNVIYLVTWMVRTHSL